MKGKILLVGDIHFSQYASILRKQGKIYSQRLETLINCLNWVENLGKEKQVDKIIYLGDFFDKSILNDMEITALGEIKWAEGIEHLFLVGNHESSYGNLKFNTTNILNQFGKVIFEPTNIILNNTTIHFLPYISDEDKTLSKYININTSTNNVILSHNDLKGVNYGKYISENGFDVEEINDNCNLFINGHLHNGGWVDNKIINIGNLCGQGFGEDAKKYKHNVILLDIDSLKLELIENPYAYNFYHIQVNDINYLDKLKSYNNGVFNIICNYNLVEDIKNKLEELNIYNYKLTIHKETDTEVLDNTKLINITTDYKVILKEFLQKNLENDDISKIEIERICNNNEY